MTIRPALAVMSVVVGLTTLSTQAEIGDGLRDARGILEQSIAAMGGEVPRSARIVGSVEIVAGGEVRRGTITSLTRGHGETREIIDAGGRTEDVVYAFGRASERDAEEGRRLSLNLMLSSDSVSLPLITIARALADPDSQFEYLGEDVVDGLPAHHIRWRNTFRSDPRLRVLEPLSVRHVWIERETLLPIRLNLDRRAARGFEPAIPKVILYANYRRVASWLVPFSIEKLYNGTPWTSVHVTSAEFDVDLGADPFRLD